MRGRVYLRRIAVPFPPTIEQSEKITLYTPMLGGSRARVKRQIATIAQHLFGEIMKMPGKTSGLLLCPVRMAFQGATRVVAALAPKTLLHAYLVEPTSVAANESGMILDILGLLIFIF